MRFCSIASENSDIGLQVTKTHSVISVDEQNIDFHLIHFIRKLPLYVQGICCPQEINLLLCKSLQFFCFQ